MLKSELANFLTLKSYFTKMGLVNITQLKTLKIMTQDLVDILLKNLLNSLAVPADRLETPNPEKPETSEKSNTSYSDELEDLLSHPGFQQFMDGDIENPIFISTFITGATVCLQIFDIASDEQLQSLPPALKEKAIPYLEKLKVAYSKAVDNIIARMTAPTSERFLEDLSKEELLDYIKSHLQ